MAIAAWSAKEGSSIAFDLGHASLDLLELVVPAHVSTQLARTYSEAAFGARTFSGPLLNLGNVPDPTISWAYLSKEKSMVAHVQARDPYAFDLDIVFDLLDADWRRMLLRLHETIEEGRDHAVYLFPTADDLVAFNTALAASDFAKAATYGLAFRVANHRVLKRVSKLEAELTDEEFNRTAVDTHDPAAHHFRHAYPEMIDIDKSMGGAAASRFGDFPCLMIDTGYHDDDNELFQEAAVRTLVQHDFTRITNLTNTFPATKHWFCVLMEHHVAVMYTPRVGIPSENMKTLFSGHLLAPRAWRQAIRDQGGLPVLVGNFHLLSGNPTQFEEAVEDAVVMRQTAAGASIIVLDLDLERLRRTITSEPPFDDVHLLLMSAWFNQSLVRSSHQRLPEVE